MADPPRVCELCGEPVEKDVHFPACGLFPAITKRLPRTCRCREDAICGEANREETEKLRRRLDKYRKYSLMDERFAESTFANWVHRPDNKVLYNIATKYCEKWDAMKTKNHGILLHGKAGNGKTYASFAIANELSRRNEAVMAVSVANLLKVIQDGYGHYGKDGEESEIEVLGAIRDAGLLILDDLGVEQKSAWSYEKRYAVIDARYRAKKPIIITTNLNLDELRESLAIVDAKKGTRDYSNRIYNRIVEMCAIVEVSGESWRIQKGEQNKVDMFRELGL